jgi:hypothetical protein
VAAQVRLAVLQAQIKAAATATDWLVPLLDQASRELAAAAVAG